jgi:2-C-methyl-D-erythritol 2,4-cyclodiphosphate synthase
VVLHAVTNAISGITGVNILGDIADSMCQQGITDSKEYLKEALKYLDWEIVNLSISIECKIPKISPRIKEMKLSIASLLNISENRIGITATTGEGLTAFGQGLGIQVFCILTVKRSLS